MSVYSSGSKWKNAAKGALASAQALEDQQRDIEFQRSLLSNIRQQRMAQAQMSLSNYSDSYTSSSAAGASASLNSSLAGEMKYSYETSQRAEDIQDYQQAAQQYMKKYAKQQKTRATAFAVTGAAAAIVAAPALAAGLGALGSAATSAGLSTIGGGLTAVGTVIEGASAFTLAQVGMGIGQMASNTGQSDIGIKNVLEGSETIYSGYKQDQTMKTLKDTIKTDTSYTNRKPVYLQTTTGKLQPVTGGYFPCNR